mmetsp:Transcript_12268/g.17942  ORF Transcript_12268/g.17942 Transcript_12268/m.17942 type:complete len:118 (-) Transcript_12268:76-429(-)
MRKNTTTPTAFTNHGKSTKKGASNSSSSSRSLPSPSMCSPSAPSAPSSPGSVECSPSVASSKLLPMARIGDSSNSTINANVIILLRVAENMERDCLRGVFSRHGGGCAPMVETKETV